MKKLIWLILFVPALTFADQLQSQVYTGEEKSNLMSSTELNYRCTSKSIYYQNTCLYYLTGYMDAVSSMSIIKVRPNSQIRMATLFELFKRDMKKVPFLNDYDAPSVLTVILIHHGYLQEGTK